ncbi:hypothetical protein [Stutzerimonas nosocomialis]|nr:hypothetical protein [Stutzerimonas nosocomialis]
MRSILLDGVARASQSRSVLGLFICQGLSVYPSVIAKPLHG